MPAIIRSVVVFPQPLGPRSATNSPSFISRFRLSTATTLPKTLVRFSSLTLTIYLPLFLPVIYKT